MSTNGAMTTTIRSTIKDSQTTNPKGADGGQERVIRGGSYQETRAALCTTHRIGSSEVSTRDNIGFRLAMDADDIRPGS